MRIYINKKVTYTIALLLCGIFLSNLSLGKTYRWKDKDGRVHYTQSIPPSGSQYGHQEIDEKNGMTVKDVESSDTRKQRLKKAQLENEKNLLKKQALREELMIYMFSSREELIAHFEERLKMISVNIRLLQFHQKKLRNTINDTGKKIKKVKAEKLKKKLQTALRDSQRSLIDHSRAIETNEQERTAVSGQMARALKTYDKRFGSAGLNVGSLIGTSVLEKFRSNGLKSAQGKGKNMCSCPCTASK